MMELGEKLNGKFENLVNYCMVSGAINQDLYNEYDVKRDFAIRMVKEYLPA